MKILNDNILLDLFLQDAVETIQKWHFFLIYVYGVYDRLFNLEGYILG